MDTKVLLSIPCWGESYHAKFAQYSLPSLLAEGNIPALIKKGYDVTLCLYTRQNSLEDLQQSVNHLVLPAGLKLSYRVLEEFIPEIGSLSNITLFSMSHQHTLEQAAQDKEIVLLLCCDALLNDTALSFAIDKVEQGYKAVLNSAVRVNFEDCRDYLLTQMQGSHRLALSSDQLVQLIVHSIHEDEKKLARPTIYGPAGWPGMCSWFKSGKGYVKHTHYYNPTLVVPDKAMSLKGATFDSSDMMDYFVEQWEQVYVVTDSDELTILDLADKHVNHLPITERRFSAFDVAMEKRFWNLPKWQQTIFNSKVCFLTKHHQRETDALLRDADVFMQQLSWWDREFSQLQINLDDERLHMINQKYRAIYGIDLAAIEKALNVMFEPYQQASILFYGMGELCEFIVNQFKLDVKAMYLSDSFITDEKRARFTYPVINLEQGLEGVDVVIPMTMQYFDEMAAKIHQLSEGSVEVVNIDWAGLLKN